MKLPIILKKNLSIAFIILIFIFCVVFIIPHDKVVTIKKTISPNSFVLNNNEIFTINDLKSFDSTFSKENTSLAKTLNITEEEAFILGNLAKQNTANIMDGRKVYIKNNSDLIYNRFSYREKFLYSGFFLKNGKPYNLDLFNKRISEVKNGKFNVVESFSKAKALYKTQIFIKTPFIYSALIDFSVVLP